MLVVFFVLAFVIIFRKKFRMSRRILGFALTMLVIIVMTFGFTAVVIFATACALAASYKRQ